MDNLKPSKSFKCSVVVLDLVHKSQSNQNYVHPNGSIVNNPTLYILKWVVLEIQANEGRRWSGSSVTDEQMEPSECFLFCFFFLTKKSEVKRKRKILLISSEFLRLQDPLTFSSFAWSWQQRHSTQSSANRQGSLKIMSLNLLNLLSSAAQSQSSNCGVTMPCTWCVHLTHVISGTLWPRVPSAVRWVPDHQ